MFERLLTNPEAAIAVVVALLGLITLALRWAAKRGGEGTRFAFSKAKNAVGRSAFEAKYREWVREANRFLRIRGIRTLTDVSIELDRVYVGLELRRSEMTFLNTTPNS